MIDASKSVEDLHEEIKEIVKVAIKEVEDNKLEALWEDLPYAPPMKRKHVDSRQVTGGGDVMLNGSDIKNC